MTLTDDQAALLRDKYVLWERASREGPMDLRDYNRRAAEALKAALMIVSEYLQPLPAPAEARSSQLETGCECLDCTGPGMPSWRRAK